jgi:hypothetical protein
MKTTIAILFLLVNLFGISQIPTMQGKVPQLYSPALAGAFSNSQVNVLTRFAFTSNTPFSFNYVGYNTHIDKIKSGVGVYFNNYTFNTGTITNGQATPNSFFNGIGFSYAFQQSLGKKWAMSAGGGVNFTRRVEFCKNCPNNKFINNYPDYSTGLLFYSKHSFYNVTVTHFSNFYFPLNIDLNIGHSFIFSDSSNTKLTVSANLFLYDYFIGLNMKSLFNYKSFYIGGSFSFLPFILFNPTLQAGYSFKRYRINYSYNPATMALINYGKIKHEISLQVKLPNKVKRRSVDFSHLLY